MREISEAEIRTAHDLAMGPAGVRHGRSLQDRVWAGSLARRDAVTEQAPDSGPPRRGRCSRPLPCAASRPTGEATVIRWEEVTDPDPNRHVGQVTSGHAAGRQAALQALRDLTVSLRWRVPALARPGG